MKVKANAKINVYLKILGKNENGYHDLDSLMVPIDLYDYIELIESEKDEIIGMDIPLESNLIYKAIEKVRKEFNIDKKVKVIIEKNIPSFAGLGGGSSDAAFVIKALNEMWDLKLNDKEMINIASTLGSDVPFFIINKPAIISGRGEKITPIKIKKGQGILIFDNHKFSTKVVFENMKEYSQPYKEIIKDIDGEKMIEDYYSLVCNDMEKGIVIYEESKEIFRQKEKLLAKGAVKASMSGSGSSVFGLFEEGEVDLVYDEIKDLYASVWKFNIIL